MTISSLANWYSLTAIIALVVSFVLIALLRWIWYRFGGLHGPALLVILVLHLVALAAGLLSHETAGFVASGVSFLSLVKAAITYARFLLTPQTSAPAQAIRLPGGTP